jgi:hypothetical protein
MEQQQPACPARPLGWCLHSCSGPPTPTHPPYSSLLLHSALLVLLLLMPMLLLVLLLVLDRMTAAP